ncbi:TetR/AcrR family transcriptional regulator [Pandoraea terrae]|nr:TetR/AcrR family transcriptional regulator [Pandoraea terrae]
MSLRETYKQLTRERLIDAALEIFDEIGFSNATIEQIANRAGTNRTTFYLHFKSKVDLASIVILRAEPDIQEVMLALNALVNPTWRDVRLWLNQWVALTRKQKVAFDVGSQLMTSADPDASASYLERGRRFASLLTNHLDRFEGKARKAAVTRYALLMMMTHQTVCNKEFRSCQFDDDEHLDLLADMLWTGLSMGIEARKAPARAKPPAPVKA